MSLYDPYVKKLRRLTKKSTEECRKILALMEAKPLYSGYHRQSLVQELMNEFALTEQEAFVLYNACLKAVMLNHRHK